MFIVGTINPWVTGCPKEPVGSTKILQTWDLFTNVSWTQIRAEVDKKVWNWVESGLHFQLVTLTEKLYFVLGAVQFSLSNG